MTGMFWKTIPSRELITTQQKYINFKGSERHSVLIDSNIFRAQTLTVYHSEKFQRA